MRALAVAAVAVALLAPLAAHAEGADAKQLRQIAGFWADRLVPSTYFEHVLEELVASGAVRVAEEHAEAGGPDREYPQAVRQMAKAWSAGGMSDADFAAALEEMVRSGVVQSRTHTPAPPAAPGPAPGPEPEEAREHEELHAMFDAYSRAHQGRAFAYEAKAWDASVYSGGEWSSPHGRLDGVSVRAHITGPDGKTVYRFAECLTEKGLCRGELTIPPNSWPRGAYIVHMEAEHGPYSASEDLEFLVLDAPRGYISEVPEPVIESVEIGIASGGGAPEYLGEGEEGTARVGDRVYVRLTSDQEIRGAAAFLFDWDREPATLCHAASAQDGCPEGLDRHTLVAFATVTEEDAPEYEYVDGPASGIQFEATVFNYKRLHATATEATNGARVSLAMGPPQAVSAELGALRTQVDYDSLEVTEVLEYLGEGQRDNVTSGDVVYVRLAFDQPISDAEAYILGAPAPVCGPLDEEAGCLGLGPNEVVAFAYADGVDAGTEVEFSVDVWNYHGERATVEETTNGSSMYVVAPHDF